MGPNAGSPRHCPGRGYVRYNQDMAERPTADDVRKAVDEDGIEFLFAHFVDMHAKPSAKLIPAEQLDGLLRTAPGSPGSPPETSASRPTTRT